LEIRTVEVKVREETTLWVAILRLLVVDTEANCERNQKDGGEMHARKGGMQMRSPAGCKGGLIF
jgi:hypothetical protein